MHIGDYKINPKKAIHIIGIGGIGMSGLSKLLHENNFLVQGSDIKENFQIKELKKIGINIFIGHHCKNILNCDLIVKSSAIKNDNEEVKEARNKSIPLISRAELLSNIIQNSYNICITGAHGKTSTTSLVYSMLKSMDIDPTVICGGIINSINSNVAKGNGNVTVVEADESDGTFMVLPTNISIITNIDAEHLDYYGNLQNIINVYILYIDKCLLKDLVITCDDCKNLKQVNNKHTNNQKLISYGIDSESCDIKAINLKSTDTGVKFDILMSEKCQKTLSQDVNIIKNIVLKNYGKHNILNALAAIITYLFKGGKRYLINSALQNNLGVKRRFTNIGKINNINFIDDYAHHPSEIKATLDVAKEHANISHGKVIAVFQPHRYSRLKDLYDQFLKSFKQADSLIVLDIFASGETNIDNISSKYFVEDIKKKSVNAFYCQNITELENKITHLSNPGDYIVFMGAGSISDIAKEVFNHLNS